MDTKETNLKDIYLTRKEVSQLLKISLSTVHNWCKSGKLKPYGLGNRIYFKMEDIENSMVKLHRDTH